MLLYGNELKSPAAPAQISKAVLALGVSRGSDQRVSSDILANTS